MRIEYGVGEEGRSALQRWWNHTGGDGIEVSRLAENFQQGRDIFARGGFVQADGQRGCIDGAQVVAVCNGVRMDLRRIASADFYLNRIEEHARNAQRPREQCG